MSKKQFHNRLDNLFADFDEVVEPVASIQVNSQNGWLWECDSGLHYKNVGEEVFGCLGIPAVRFQGQPILTYAVAPQSSRLLKSVFEQDVYPVEIDIFFQSPEGAYVPARLSIYHRPKQNGGNPGWYGSASVLSRAGIPQNPLDFLSISDHEDETAAPYDIVPSKLSPAQPTSPKPIQIERDMQDHLKSTFSVWHDTQEKIPKIQIPIDLHSQGEGMIEITTEADDRNWTEDERQLVQEVAKQLSIAIESAQSYELTQKAFEDMRQADHMKSQFLANMSHELRTPLNSIIGFSRVILKGIDGDITDTQRQDLTSIYNSGQHLLGLINDVLDLSKIEAGKMEMQLDNVNLLELINSVRSTAVGLVKDKPIKLVNILPETLPIVSADSTRIRQVLLNFLSNAAKFTDEGSIIIKAEESTSPSGNPEVLVTVTDSGEGISEDDRDKLFQPFSQVDDSPTRKTGGTGLGLSICRSFMEMHQGRIGLLSSEVGQGSTFFFALPISKETAQFSEKQ
jgi:signal transduction histidine kinase